MGFPLTQTTLLAVPSTEKEAQIINLQQDHCKAAHKEHKERFTYTLLHIEDIVEAYSELAVEEKMAA